MRLCTELPTLDARASSSKQDRVLGGSHGTNTLTGEERDPKYKVKRRGSTVGRALALHVASQNLVPWHHTQFQMVPRPQLEGFLSTEPGATLNTAERDPKTIRIKIMLTMFRAG